MFEYKHGSKHVKLVTRVSDYWGDNWGDIKTWACWPYTEAPLVMYSWL